MLARGNGSVMSRVGSRAGQPLAVQCYTNQNAKQPYLRLLRMETESDIRGVTVIYTGFTFNVESTLM